MTNPSTTVPQGLIKRLIAKADYIASTGSEAMASAKLMREAAALLSQQQPLDGGAGEWRPIETAPKDTDILVCLADLGDMVVVHSDGIAWVDANDDIIEGVTHWMPLPAPPGSAAPVQPPAPTRTPFTYENRAALANVISDAIPNVDMKAALYAADKVLGMAAESPPAPRTDDETPDFIRKTASFKVDERRAAAAAKVDDAGLEVMAKAAIDALVALPINTAHGITEAAARESRRSIITHTIDWPVAMRAALEAAPALSAGRDEGGADAHERELGQVIDERDAAEEALSQAFYLITGHSPEWSDLFGHAEALEEIGDAQFLLRKAALSAGVGLDEEKVARIICANQLSGFCANIGHEVRGCMVGQGVKRSTGAQRITQHRQRDHRPGCRGEAVSELVLDARRTFSAFKKVAARVSTLEAEKAALIAENGRLGEARDWQPIETAPKDGRQILVWDRADRETDKLYWMQDHWNNILGHAVDADALTHWMPLPDPPRAALDKPALPLDGRE